MQDYNWFFTTIAQSAAAIVGFFGAFIITKIINIEIEFSNLKRRYNDIISDIIKQKSNFSNRYFEWYNRRIREDEFESENFSNLVSEIGKSNLTDENLEYIIFFSKFSIFDDYDKLKILIKEEIGKSINKTSAFGRSLINPQPVTEKRDYINIEISSTLQLIEKIKSLISEIESFPSSKTIILFSLISIVLMFIIGIIYPLSFLPTNNSFELCFGLECFKDFFVIYFNCFKSVLLLIFSLIFITIIIVFLKINKSHNFENENIKDLKEQTKIDNYSGYLKNYVKNKEFRNDFKIKLYYENSKTAHNKA